MTTPNAVHPVTTTESDTYFVIIKEHLNLLIEHVNAKIAEGWIAKGGVATWNNTDGRTYFLQAVVKQ